MPTTIALSISLQIEQHNTTEQQTNNNSTNHITTNWQTKKIYPLRFLVVCPKTTNKIDKDMLRHLPEQKIALPIALPIV